jgi:hypothetical protein
VDVFAPRSLASGGVVPRQMMEVRERQYSKAADPMLVTLLPIVTEVREEQRSKALPPMLVTLLGIVIEMREEQR